MKYLKMWLGVLLCLVSCCGFAQSWSSEPSVIFINASQHNDGTTAKFGKILLANLDYEQVDLNQYAISFLGQTDKSDEFEALMDKLANAKVILIGTPIYWHSMSGSLKTFIERASELGNANPLKGKTLYFFLQGEKPNHLSKESTLYIIQRFASQVGMNLKGTATDNKELQQLKALIDSQEKK